MIDDMIDVIGVVTDITLDVGKAVLDRRKEKKEEKEKEEKQRQEDRERPL